MEIRDIYHAGQIILDECPNEYAKAYADALDQAAYEGEIYYGSREHGLKMQALYILSNITHWRGDTAKAVRAYLKEYAK